MPNLQIRSSTPIGSSFERKRLREIKDLKKQIESMDELLADDADAPSGDDASDLLASHANFLNQVANSHVAATDPRVLKTMRDTHDLLKSMAPDSDDDEDTESDDDSEDEKGEPLTESARGAARRYDFAFDAGRKAFTPGAIAIGVRAEIAAHRGDYRIDSFEKPELKEVCLTESHSRARPARYNFTFEKA